MLKRKVLLFAASLAAAPICALAQTDDLLFEHQFENSTIGGPTLDLWYGDTQTFGAAGVSQTFANLLGNVSDANGVSSLSYRLNNGPSVELTLGRKNARLARFQDFNAELAFDLLNPGPNQVEFRAIDGRNNESTRQIIVNYVDDVSTPRNYSIDWTNVEKIADVAQVVDGKWHLTDDGVRTSEIGYDRIIAIGDLDWVNYEATAEFTLHDVPEVVKRCPLLALAMRWNGHMQRQPGEQPGTKWWPLGGQAGYRWFTCERGSGYNGLQMFGGNGESIRDHISMEIPPLESKHTIKMRGESQPGGMLVYRIKLWPSADPEPLDWNLSWSTPATETMDSGSLLLVAHHLDVSFSSVAVTPLDD